MDSDTNRDQGEADAYWRRRVYVLAGGITVIGLVAWACSGSDHKKSTAQVRNAERSIRAFFGGPGDPNGSTTRGLLDIPGWEKMAFTEAAQAVQISAYPNAYAQWEKPAYAWLKAVR